MNSQIIPRWNEPMFESEEHMKPKYRIPDQQYPRLNCHSSSMKRYFGLRPAQKWPVNGMSDIYIVGIRVWVDALPLLRPANSRRRPHRVMAECPGCKAVMSAGRLFSHVCKPRQ